MIVRDEAADSYGELASHSWTLGALSGCVLGVVVAFASRGLGPSMAPLALLVVLTSTLVAGRIAQVGPAVAHGACAWLAIVTTASLTHTILEPWHGLPAAGILFVLIEDMVLLGRLGRGRRSNR